MLFSLSLAAMVESLSIVESKAVLSYFADQIPTIDRSVVKDVCGLALVKLQGRIVSFEDQVSYYIQLRLVVETCCGSGFDLWSLLMQGRQKQLRIGGADQAAGASAEREP